MFGAISDEATILDCLNGALRSGLSMQWLEGKERNGD